jgi:hypothetical protein
MPKGQPNGNAEILAYALRHLEKEREDIETRISFIRKQLGVRVSAWAPAAAASAEATPAGRKKRVLSASARRRIAAAQKKRWAEHRKLKAKAAKAD